MLWKFIVKSSFSTKLILSPFSIICQSFRLIVKLSVALHMTIDPLTIIHASILIVKSTFSLLDTIDFVSFIATSLGIHLSDILALWVSIKLARNNKSSALFYFVQTFIFHCAGITIKNHIFINLSVSYINTRWKYISQRSGGGYITRFEQGKSHLIWNHWTLSWLV